MKPSSIAAGGEPIAFAPDRAVLAMRTTSPGGSVGLIDLDGDRALCVIPIAGARSLAFSPDSRLVAIGGDDEAVTVRGAATGRPVASFDGHRHRPDPWGDNLPSWLADFGLARRRVRNSVWSVAFSPAGPRLASVGGDGSVWLWSLPGRDPVGPPDRAVLPRSSRPVWLPGFRVTVALAGLTLLALAIGARGK
jgi:WD40 repeat protein